MIMIFDNSLPYISIHAPLRERPRSKASSVFWIIFQSTLPCGSDRQVIIHTTFYMHFNPRSLAGATKANDWAIRCVHISIHAPLRERLRRKNTAHAFSYFNPRSLAGATIMSCSYNRAERFQSTLPCGSDEKLK